MTKTEKAIRQMEAWARDDSHGYDQRYRWGELGDYDCSSAVISAWQAAGVPVKSMGATYTGDMVPAFTACGFADVTGSVNFKTGEGLKRGDVLLNVKYHTAMYCGGGYEVEASINENGGDIGGRPGDQTGWEFLIRPYRDYPWNICLRYMGDIETDDFLFYTHEVGFGSMGLDVWRGQMILYARGFYTSITDACFGPLTRQAVTEFQKVAKIPVTGKLDADTWATLLGLERTTDGAWIAEPCCEGFKHDKTVLLVQEVLKAAGYYTGGLTWDFGPDLREAVLAFQRDAKALTVNGKADRPTLAWLIGED